MFVHPARRRQGLSKIVLDELEQWAVDLGYKNSILETGSKQPEAIALYKRSGYQQTDRFGVYKELQNSLCFIKKLV
jgi:putative acetyltransferase